MVDATGLREQLTQHLASVRATAEDNEFVDVARAETLHSRLDEALDGWDALDQDQRGSLAEAIAYLVRIDDDEDDLRSPIGFDDDDEVVEAALRAIKPGGTGSAPPTR